MENTYRNINDLRELHQGDEVQCCLDGSILRYTSIGNFNWFTGKIQHLKTADNGSLELNLLRHDHGQNWYVHVNIANIIGIRLFEREWD